MSRAVLSTLQIICLFCFFRTNDALLFPDEHEKSSTTERNAADSVLHSLTDYWQNTVNEINEVPATSEQSIINWPSVDIPSFIPPINIPNVPNIPPIYTPPGNIPSFFPPTTIPPIFAPVHSSTTMNPTPASKGDCSDGLYSRHEKDCSAFYRCLPNGKRVKFSCGPFQYFDLSISGCNYKNLVKC